MKSGLFFVVVACVAGVVCADLVKVVIMTESLCPDCINFASTDLKETLGAEGVYERLSVQYLAWGNAYTETTSSELCPSPTPGKYNSDVRKCWASRCVRNAAPDLFAECFNTSFKDHITCQHGEEENFGNLIESCAVYISRNTTTGMMSRTGANFIECFLGEHHGQKDSTLICAKSAGIDYDQIMSCVNSDFGYSLLSDEAVETNDYGTHPGVPYVLINLQPLPDDKSLLKGVCEQMVEPKPAGCKWSASAPRTWGKC